MQKVIDFPANRIAKGLHCYTPEMGQRKPNCQIRAQLGHYGEHYYIDTPMELKGRGIRHLKQYTSNDLTGPAQYMVGWHQYKVTVNAFEKLQQAHSVSMECLLD